MKKAAAYTLFSNSKVIESMYLKRATRMKVHKARQEIRFAAKKTAISSLYLLTAPLFSTQRGKRRIRSAWICGISNTLSRIKSTSSMVMLVMLFKNYSAFIRSCSHLILSSPNRSRRGCLRCCSLSIHSRPRLTKVSISSSNLAIPIVVSSFILLLIFSTTMIPTLLDGYFFLLICIFAAYHPF